ncbi:TNF receptor-associated factor 5-like [Haemaphysalis longicornis]
MAATGTQCYTVFDFDSPIDWRPTVFVDGFPKTRVCSACGLVSATIALLPCHHTLCHRCYDDHRERKECDRCPLDKDVCKPEDVIWSTFTSDNLLQRQIHCWNLSNGCDALGAACEIVEHFQKDCQYHAVTCFRCKQSMAYKELSGHLETNDCFIPEGNASSMRYGSLDATITPFAHDIRQLRDQLSSVQSSLQETKELIAGQVQLFRERADADMHVTESVHTLDNTLKESMRQSQLSADRTAEELALITNTLRDVLVSVRKIKTSLETYITEATSEVIVACQNLHQELEDFTDFTPQVLWKTEQRLECLENTARERLKNELDMQKTLKCLNERLSDDVCRNISALGKAAQVISELPLCTSEPLVWTVRGWSKLKKAATINGEVEASAEKPKYFFGYSILPGIRILKDDGDLTLHLIYRVCQGGYDSLLGWPLRKKLCFNVFNAEGEEIPQEIVLNLRTGAFKQEERPTTARNDPICSRGYTKMCDIERNGCVKNDEVSFKFTVSQLC